MKEILILLAPNKLDLAKELGVSRRQLGYYLSGETPIPKKVKILIRERIERTNSVLSVTAAHSGNST